MFDSFVQYNNVFPLIAPVDLGTTATNTPHVALKGAHHIGFLVNFGVTTENACADIISVTVVAATAEGAVAQTPVTFNYRVSGIVTANTWGAITAATVTGAQLTNDDEGKSLWIEVDPDALAASDYTHLHLNIEPNAFTVCLASVTAFIDTRYKMTTMATATACASA